MRHDNGISIIIADTQAEVDSIMDTLELEQVFQLKSLEETFFHEPEATYYIILSCREEMERFTQYLSIKRGVLSAKGKREMLGFNVDWMRKVMRRRQPATTQVLATEIPNRFGEGFNQPVEKDDPYADLGYRR